MKKLGNIGFLLITVLLIATVLCGCGGETFNGALEPDAAYHGETLEADYEAGSAKAGKANSESTSGQVAQNRKIIEYITLTVETKTFDKLIGDIHAAVSESGGYIENSDIGGNRYYNSDNRSAELKIRVPKAKQDDFSDFISENGNVVNRSVSTEDVTDQYVDTESRIKALTLEKETLESLLTQSTSVADMLSVYERLTDVIAEIESYQGRLNQLDNLVEYTTFTVYIEEVQKETPAEEQSWFAKTLDGLLNSFSDLGNGLLTLLSFLIIALPYWLLLSAIALTVLFFIRRGKKKQEKAKKEQKTESVSDDNA